MRVCVCVCMCVRVRVCTYMCVYSKSFFVCVCVCACMYVCVCVHVCFIRSHGDDVVYFLMLLHTVFVCESVGVCVCVCVCVCVYACRCVCACRMCVCVYVKYTHTHTGDKPSDANSGQETCHEEYSVELCFHGQHTHTNTQAYKKTCS